MPNTDNKGKLLPAFSIKKQEHAPMSVPFR